MDRFEIRFRAIELALHYYETQGFEPQKSAPRILELAEQFAAFAVNAAPPPAEPDAAALRAVLLAYETWRGDEPAPDDFAREELVDSFLAARAAGTEAETR